MGQNTTDWKGTMYAEQKPIRLPNRRQWNRHWIWDCILHHSLAVRVRPQMHWSKRKKRNLFWSFLRSIWFEQTKQKASFSIFFSNVSSTSNYSVTVIVHSMWFEQSKKTAPFGAFFVCFSRRGVPFLFCLLVFFSDIDFLFLFPEERGAFFVCSNY